MIVAAVPAAERGDPTTRPGTVSEALERAAQQGAGGLRLLDRRERERWLGWDELAARARRVGGGLRELGVAPGDVLALVFPTGEGFFDAFFGALAAGAVPAPLPPPLRLGGMDGYSRRTAGILESLSACMVLAEPRTRRLLDAAVARARPPLGCRSPAELPDGGSPEPAVRGSEELALVQLSSGTTGSPRPIALSHRALLAQARLLNGFWPDRGSAPPSLLSWLPLYHDMGLIGCVLPALTRPGELTLLPPELFVARPAAWLRALSRTRATISAAPCFAYRHTVEKVTDADLGGVDLSAWTAALCGAETVSPEVLRAFTARFAPVGLSATAPTPVYGLAEAALAVTFSELDRPPAAARFDRAELSRGRARESAEGREIAAVGTPVPGFEVALLPPDRRPRDTGLADRLPPDRIGRVWVRGPSLMSGYLGQPEATARALVHGWLDTGDLGFLHQGRLFLTGRAKDVLIVHGRNHAPDELEQAAAGVAGARGHGAVAATVLLDEARGEELLLLVERQVVPRPSDEKDPRALARACRKAALAATGLPVDRVVVVEPAALPRTSSGKLRRGEAVRLYRLGELPVLAEVAG